MFANYDYNKTNLNSVQFFSEDEDKKMRFFKLSALIILCFNISSVANSQTPPNNQFYDNLLISEEYSVVSDEDIASQDAKAKLQAKRNKINIDDDIKLKQIIKNQRRENKQRASTHQHIKRISQLRIKNILSPGNIRLLPV